LSLNIQRFEQEKLNMKRYLFGLIGLALFGASFLIGQTPAFGGESCCPEAGCKTCGDGCGNACCPSCGCKLVPVCNIKCETKKEAIHKYCCTCKDICIPRVTPICQSGECCENGCDGCCRVREIHKLVIHPATKEHQVRVCTVSWTCPRCGSNAPATIPSVAPAAPAAPTAPVPAPGARRLPPPPKTTDIAPLPEDTRMAGAGF
jgi:hypothetical protein